MPHRIHVLMSSASYLVEGVLLFCLSTYSGVKTLGSIIAESDWSKITGPHGVAFVALVAVVVMWNNARVRERNEDARRTKEAEAADKKHNDTIKLQKENAEKLMELTAESIKAHGKSVGAITSMDRTIMALTEELKDRPCQQLKPH